MGNIILEYKAQKQINDEISFPEINRARGGYIYYALSMDRAEIDRYLTKDESDALDLAFYMNRKEEIGEFTV